MVVVATTFLAGCGGKGSSSSAPTNVKVVAGDTSAIVSWDMQPGVEYWVYKAAGTNVTPQNCNSIPECKTALNVSSPTVITGLNNGTTYSFTIDGRTGGGPGGPGSPSVSATPRLAGGLAGTPWSASNPLGTQDLHGVAYGVPSGSTLGAFVVVGAKGALFSSTGTLSSSPDGLAWVTLTNPVPAASLNAVTYNSGRFLAVGSGGVILLSTDAVTWAKQTSVTSNDLYAVSNNGTGFIATGANGTILTSGDGATWAVVPPVTTNALYGITSGNGYFVAVGAAGTLLTSMNGVTWQTVTSLSTSDLRGVTYGVPQYYANGVLTLNQPAATFVAIGANGTLVTSPDGVTWTLRPQISTTQLNAVTYGQQFIAVDTVGSIFASIDGLTWQQAKNPTSPLYAVTHAQYFGGQYNGEYVYSAVGASGVNLLAK